MRLKLIDIRILLLLLLLLLCGAGGVWLRFSSPESEPAPGSAAGEGNSAAELSGAGEASSPMALRRERRAARLRKIWRASGAAEVEFLVSLTDARELPRLLTAYPALRVVVCEKEVIRLRAPLALAEAFAERLPEGVEWITSVKEAVLLNLAATSSRFLGLAEPLRLSKQAPMLDGRGEVVAVIDTGLDTGIAATLHSDLLPQLYGMVVEPSISGAVNQIPLDLDGHGTHVCGSVVSQGVNQPWSLGSAPGAHLFVQRIGTSSDGNLSPFNTDGLHFERSYAAGARIISCSWMKTNSKLDSNSFVYDESTAESLDEFVWNNPDATVLVAVGNNGIDSDQNGVIDLMSVRSYEAYAKNAVTVGAQESFREDYIGKMNAYSTAGTPISDDRMAKPRGYPYEVYDGMAAFSSRGPLTDKRIAPMIVTPGSAIYSTQKGGGGCYMDGTSMATPLAAGSAAVLRQYLKACHGLADPTAAAVRAGLILCAESLYPGQYGTGDYCEIPDTSPNPVEGWGALRLGKHLTGSATLGFKDRISLKTGERESFTVTIPETSAEEEFVAVLSWIDAPGTHPDGTRTLINDYDLSVTAPDGTRCYPLGNAADRVNPIERIRIPAAQPGTYTVTVTGTQIVQEGKGNLAAVAWRAPTAEGAVDLPEAGPVPEETVSLTVHQPLGARAYLDFPLYPAPGTHAFAKGTTVRVLSGARLPTSDSGTPTPLCGWILRKADGTRVQSAAASFDLTLDQNMTLQWYTLFPGMRLLLR